MGDAYGSRHCGVRIQITGVVEVEIFSDEVAPAFVVKGGGAFSAQDVGPLVEAVSVHV